MRGKKTSHFGRKTNTEAKKHAPHELANGEPWRDFFLFSGRSVDMGNLIKKFGLDWKCGFDCKLRTKARRNPASAALERQKNSDFCVLETPKRGAFNGKLDCKSGGGIFMRPT